MKNSNSIIVKIVLLVILAVFLIGVMLFFMLSKWGFGRFYFSFGDSKSSELVVSEIYNVSDVKKVDLNLLDSDVDIKYSDGNDIKLEIYDKNSKNILYGLKDGLLTVDFERKSIICIGFCFNNRKTVLYIPKEFDKFIEVDSASGDVNIDNFVNANFDVSTASGDVKLNGAKEGSVNTVSGEVNVRDIPTLSVKTISGDIFIENVNSLNGSSVSGSVDVISLNGFINFKTTSGDYELKNIILESNSKLSSISGEVLIEGINEVYVNTSTISGEIEVNTSDRKSDIELTIKTTSGDIEVN